MIIGLDVSEEAEERIWSAFGDWWDHGYPRGLDVLSLHYAKRS